jgi:predicted DNA-binding ribbon-helix-helix protein
LIDGQDKRQVEPDRPHRMSLAVCKRSVVIAGHRTSISLEEAFWAALRVVAQRRRLSVNALVAAVDAERRPEQPGRLQPGNLSSALRVFILDCYRHGELPVEAPVGAGLTAPE